MSARRQSSRWRVPSFLGISLLGHAFLVLIVMAAGLTRGCFMVNAHDLAGPSLPTRYEPIDITMIEPAPLNPLERPRSEEEEERAVEMKVEEARKQLDDPEARGQVVEIPEPAVEVRPDKADFLSEYDSKVDKQTVAPDRGARPGAEVAAPPRPTPSPAPSTVDRARAEGEKGKGTLAMRSRGTGDPPPRLLGSERGTEEVGPDGILPKLGKDGSAETDTPAGSSDGTGGPVGEPGQGETSPDLEDLRPSEEALARVVGEGSSDYLKDIDEGAGTLLNTKRWKYASFFNRVKRAVAQNWHPDVAYRLRDPTGQIYGQKNRLTIVKVSIHPNGKIRDILIEKPCGVDFLDDEAVSAFRGAEPFPNPPAGLVDKDSNLITFRFGFMFEISSAPSFRIFRYSH